MVLSHMAPCAGEAAKYSMQPAPWSTHLLQLRERNELGGAAAGGRAVDAGATDAQPPLHRNRCQSTEEGDGFLPFQSQQQGPPRTSCSTIGGTLNIAQHQGKKAGALTL